jgi:hypothetical protein
MTFPGPNDWCFVKIAAHEPERAALLEAGMGPDELTNRLSTILVNCIKDGLARYGLNSKNNCPRIIIQIPVEPEIYDQFFNGRNGYRAHYWTAPDTGDAFDNRLVCLLRQAIDAHMPTTVEGRRVEVKLHKGREECDVGHCPITRDFTLQSLAPEASKAWICEWLIRDVRGLLQWQPAAVSGPRLIVEKWKASDDGLRAPWGEWLDFKGGFVDDSGRAAPSKDRNKRAKQIHDNGWT